MNEFKKIELENQSLRNQLEQESQRAEGFKRGLRDLLRDLYPLMVCMILLGCIAGSCLSAWIFYGLGG